MKNFTRNNFDKIILYKRSDKGQNKKKTGMDKQEKNNGKI